MSTMSNANSKSPANNTSIGTTANKPKMSSSTMQQPKAAANSSSSTTTTLTMLHIDKAGGVVKVENASPGTGPVKVAPAVVAAPAPAATVAPTIVSKAPATVTLAAPPATAPPQPETALVVAAAPGMAQPAPAAATTTTVVEQPQQTQQIYIIQTGDGTVPMESAEVVVADDMAVYETVSALEQLSRGQVVTTSDGGEQLIQVYEEVVLPSGDQYVDVAEVEVGDGRSASPVKIDTAAAIAARLRQSSTSDREDSPQGEYHICRICTHFVPISEIAEHNREQHGAAVSELTCSDCGKLFKSKRSLFGHKKEKHSGVTEVHTCPECGKTFGRKSNLKAHRESLHYGKKFPCQFCERIFTNRSSMNQHIKKTHSNAQVLTADNIIL